MGKLNVEIKEDSRSLHNPAWEPTRFGVPIRPGRESKLEGKYIFLQTRNAIYDRVLVVKDSSECLLVRFVKKTDKKTGEVKRISDSIQKRDIKHIRVYKD